MTGREPLLPVSIGRRRTRRAGAAHSSPRREARNYSLQPLMPTPNGHARKRRVHDQAAPAEGLVDRGLPEQHPESDGQAATTLPRPPARPGLCSVGAAIRLPLAARTTSRLLRRASSRRRSTPMSSPPAVLCMDRMCQHYVQSKGTIMYFHGLPHSDPSTQES